MAATSGSDGAWAMSLTGAELRLLPYLATHLMFPEIASRLFISRNTVKTEAVSIYRKLGVSSRSEAIERAVEVGLLESSIYPPRGRISPRRDDAPAAAVRSDMGTTPMDEYKEHLRRLAVHDDALARRDRGGRQLDTPRPSSTSGPRHSCASPRRRRRCGPRLVPARGGARPRGRGDERRDRRQPRGGDTGDGRRASRPVRSEGRARARLRRRRRARAA